MMNSYSNRNRYRNNDDVSRQRNMSRESDYENYSPYPAMDEHYRMYRDWNDNAHYGSPGYDVRYDDSGRTGYMQYDTERDRTRISAYGYRTVGDHTNYGHSGTNDPYDPRYHDRERQVYGMGAGTYSNGSRDEEMRYDSRNDWDMRSHRMNYDYRQAYNEGYDRGRYDERRRYEESYRRRR